MACRCSEISKCERDIALINGDIAQKLNNARNNSAAMAAKFSAISRSLSEAIFANNLDKVDQRLSTIKKQHEGYIDNLQSKRTSELSRVKSRRTSYDNEDRRYHEMLEQKAGK